MESEERPTWRLNKQRVIEIIMLVVSLIIVVILAAISNYGLRPFERGFYCNDPALSHPFNPSNTVSSTALFTISIIIPLFVILLVEVVNCFVLKVKEKLVYNAIFASYRFLFGYAMTIIVTMTVKNMSGSLRPYFLNLCRPDYSTIDCNSFVTNYTCQETDEYLLTYARNSFPSGHTSFAVYSAAYVTVYLNLRASWPILEFLIASAQTIACLMATYSSISRVLDHKHHIEDVIGGAIVGILIAIAMFKNYLPNIINGTSDFRTVDFGLAKTGDQYGDKNTHTRPKTAAGKEDNGHITMTTISESSVQE